MRVIIAIDFDVEYKPIQIYVRQIAVAKYFMCTTITFHRIHSRKRKKEILFKQRRTASMSLHGIRIFG